MTSDTHEQENQIADEPQFIHVNVYDSHACSTIQPVDFTTRMIDMCKAIHNKLDCPASDSKYYNLIIVVSFKYGNTFYHCLRTLSIEEFVLSVQDLMISKIKILSCRKENNVEVSADIAIKWFYKDTREPPLEMGETGELIGEYILDQWNKDMEKSEDNDDIDMICTNDNSEEGEFPISHSDLVYLSRNEKKGFLLKRSCRDPNIWKKWYCILTDHLWCININSFNNNKNPQINSDATTTVINNNPTAICIKLVSMSVSGAIMSTPTGGSGKKMNYNEDKIQDIIVKVIISYQS